ncbi:unnamed protein product [Arctogadus glacialis]
MQTGRDKEKWCRSREVSNRIYTLVVLRQVGAFIGSEVARPCQNIHYQTTRAAIIWHKDPLACGGVIRCRQVSG